MTGSEQDGADVLRRTGEELRGQAGELRRTAETLLTRAAELPWEGRAADTMRQRVQERAARLRAVADAHEAAADALEGHAAAVASAGGPASAW